MSRKGIFSLILVLLMISSCFMFALPAIANPVVYDISAAQDMVDNGDGTYTGSLTATFDPTTNTLTISGSGEMMDYTSSSSIPWYSNRSGIYSILFEEGCGITNIGDYAFSYLDNLTEINIPTSVTTIGMYAFYSSFSSDATLIVPQGVREINAYAFSNADLSEITLSEGIATIYSNAFSDMVNIEKLVIPASVTNVEMGSFAGMLNLKTIEILSENIIGESFYYYYFSTIGNISYNYNLHNATGKNQTEDKTATLSKDNYYLRSVLEKLGYTVTANTGYSEEEKWASYPSSFVFDIGANGDNVKAYINELNGSIDFVGSGAIKDNPVYSNRENYWPYTKRSNIPWWQYTETFKSITFHEGITRVGSRLFAHRYSDSSSPVYEGNVESIVLPSTLKEIGEYAFNGIGTTAKVMSVVIPNGVEIVGQGSFAGTYGVDMDLPDSITTIGASAFSSATPLSTTLNIPNGITEIEASTFAGISGIESIVVPEGVTSIGNSAFSSMTDLKTVELPSTLNTLGSRVFSGDTKIDSFTLKSTDTSGFSSDPYGDMGSSVSPKYASVPASQVYTIGKLESLGYEVTDTGTATEEDKWASYPTENIFNCGVDGDNVKAYYNPFEKAMYLVGSGAMYDYDWDGGYNGGPCNPYHTYVSGLKKIVVGEGITRVGSGAFSCYYYAGTWTNHRYRAYNLEELVLPSTLKEIGTGAFASAGQTAQVLSFELPDGVEVIGVKAFSGAYGLNMDLPDSITTIGASAFDGVDSEVVSIPTSATSIGSSAFANNETVKEIEIPSTMTTIPSGLLSGCTALETIEMAEGVETIEATAFQGLTSLKTVSIPSTVSDIGANAFNNCSNLSDFTMNSTQTEKFDINAYGNMGNAISPKTATIAASEVYTIGILEDLGYDVNAIGEATEEDIWGSFPLDYTYVLGDNVKGYYNPNTGTLDIVGSGSTYDFNTSGGTPITFAQNIKVVNVHEGVTRLGDKLFHYYYMGHITYINGAEINLPSTLKETGYGTFDYAKIDTITFPEGFTTMDQSFGYSASVGTMVLPSTLTTYNQYSYSYIDTALYNYSKEDQPFIKNADMGTGAEVYLYSTNTSMFVKASEMTSEDEIHFLDEPATEGVLENGIKWTYDVDTKTLRFDTTNATSTELPEYDSLYQPWATSFYQYGAASRYDFGGVTSIGSSALMGLNYGSVGNIDYYGSNASGFGGSISSQTGVSSVAYGGSVDPDYDYGSGGSQGGGSTDNDNENTGGSTATGIKVYTKDYNETEFVEVTFPDAQPFIKDGIVYTPIRFVNNDLGATVQWNNNTQTATISFYEGEDVKRVRMQPNSNEMEIEINGVKSTIELDSTIILSENRLFLPGEEIIKAWSDWEFSKDRSSVTLYEDYYTRLTPQKEAPEGLEEDGVEVDDENISEVLRTFDNTAIIVNQNATNFKVTVPFVVNVNMDANANITTTEGLTVDNKCAWGPVLIKKINVITKEDWLLGDIENEDFINMPVNSKKIGLSINGSPVKTDGTMVLNDSLSSVIKYQDSKELVFDAKLPAQSKSMSDTVAGIIFTLDWDKVE